MKKIIYLLIGNTGFYYVRSNPMTIKLWKDAYDAAPMFPHLDDQAVFWRVIRTSSDPKVKPLGPCHLYIPEPGNLSYII